MATRRAKPPATAPRAWPAVEVVERPIGELKPHPRNAREHSPSQVRRIMASMRQWGWTMPILVDEADTILAGHGRLLAAQRLRIEKVPVMVARGWTDEQKRAYMIADNRLPELSEWDDDALKEQLAELDLSGFDVSLTGFDFDDFLVQDEEKEKRDAAGKKARRRAENEATAIFGIIIEAENEEEQAELLERFLEEGLTCRALM